MRLYFFIILLLSTFCFNLQGQSSTCQQRLRDADVARSNQDYLVALRKYTAARNYCADEQVIDERIEAMFKEIENLRIQAIEAEEKANEERIISDRLRAESEKQADTILTVNETLNATLHQLQIQQTEKDSILENLQAEQAKNRKIIDAFYFYDDRLALAYRDGRYGFIDKEGNVKIDYKYYEALPFQNNGFALVKKYSNEYLIDYAGKEYVLLKNLRRFPKNTSKATAIDLQKEPYSFNILKRISLPRKILGCKVVFLSLGSNSIERIPDKISLLQDLKYLNLSDNKLKTLPESFGQLSQLQTLELRSNALSTLPESFGQLSRLQTLYLSYNFALSVLPESFGQLSQLRTLSLKGNNLSILPKSFGQLSQLQTLNLSYNYALSALPESFGQLNQLQTLDLSCNSALSALPESFGQLSQLRTLNLSGNISPIRTDLEGYEFFRLSKEFLKFIINIQTLSSSTLKSLPESFGQLSQLQTLNLSYNSALSALPESFGQLFNLQLLDLRATPKLQDLRVLTTFYQTLAIVTISDRDYDYEPAVKEGQLLLILSAELERLPESIRSLKNLKRLDARNSNFSEGYKTQLKEMLPWCEILF